ncbi:MAG TPA: cysteine methyltransferase [Dehalococcoidia bacterium]|nr:cysteine methyltransferase [Dehalococcoidia bacterium]
MNEELKYITFDTDMGWVGILASARGLTHTTLPQPSAREARQLLGDWVNHATWSPHLFYDLTGRLKAYFSGHKVVFPDELDLSEASTFQREVWQITSLIPYGETRSYLWVAEQIGSPGAARAAGQALATNPLPVIIPCHRVTATSGKPGGYSGGVKMKRYLLNLEAPAAVSRGKFTVITLC